MKRFILVAIVMAGCGGSDKQGPTTPDKATPVEKDEHAGMTPELTAFHDVLKPRWHAEPGEARVNDTCGATADFAAKAEAVHAAAAPAGVDAAAWDQAGLRLIKAVEGLAAACETARGEFDARFEELHNAFHHAMELQMGEHEHGEHHEHGAEMGGMKH